MGIKLVIADDAPFIREAVRGIISGTEIDCIGEAVDGNEAVAVVIHKKPDVVFMDLVMPQKNGIEATREIISKNPQIRIVACSTEGQEDLILRALDAGCCNYLSKPFTAPELLKVLRAAAEKK